MTFNFDEGPEKIYVDRFDSDTPSLDQTRLHFRSGTKSYIFVLPIILTKKIARLFSKQVELYEKVTNQTLDDTLDNDPVLSPIQQKK